MSSITPRDRVNKIIDSFSSGDKREVKNVTNKIVSILRAQPELQGDTYLRGRLINISIEWNDRTFIEIVMKFFPITSNIGESQIENNPKFLLTNLVGPMLEAKDLASLSRTSKGMRAKTSVALDRALVMKLNGISIGEDLWRSLEARVTSEEWAQLKPNLDNIPLITKEILGFLKSDCRYHPGKKVFETHKLVLMPLELSINKIGKLTKYLREGEHESVFDPIWNEIPAEILEKKNSQSYWAVITTEVIPDSQNKPYIEQKKLIKDGYEVPSVLELVTLATMHLESAEEYLLPVEPWTYTRCSDKIGNYRLVVGSFCSSGLNVNYDYGTEGIGVMAVWKFY